MPMKTTTKPSSSSSILICNIATPSLIYVVFFYKVINLCKPLSKLDLPTLRKGCRDLITLIKKTTYINDRVAMLNNGINSGLL